MTTNQKENKFADVPIRVKSWCYIIILFDLMLITTISMHIGVTLLSVYALFEFSAMIGLKQKIFRYIYLCLSLPLFGVLYKNDYQLFVHLCILFALILLIVNTFIVKKPKKTIQLIIAVFVCVFCIGHLSFIREIDSPLLSYSGIKLTIFVVLLTELNDVFQYLTGKTFGKHKIVPQISPNKTVEGFIGGVILTALLAAIIGLFLLPTGNIFIGTLFGFLIAIIGFCGDIFMSAIKRKAKVKDTGNLIPGHGGLLDRMDSLLFVLPLFYWSFVLLYKQ